MKKYARMVVGYIGVFWCMVALCEGVEENLTAYGEVAHADGDNKVVGADPIDDFQYAISRALAVSEEREREARTFVEYNYGGSQAAQNGMTALVDRESDALMYSETAEGGVPDEKNNSAVSLPDVLTEDAGVVADKQEESQKFFGRSKKRKREKKAVRVEALPGTSEKAETPQKAPKRDDAVSSPVRLSCCPSCGRKFSNSPLIFCPQDGAKLIK